MYANKWDSLEEMDKALKNIQATKTESGRNRKPGNSVPLLICFVFVVRRTFEDSPFEPSKCLLNENPFPQIYCLYLLL